MGAMAASLFSPRILAIFFLLLLGCFACNILYIPLIALFRRKFSKNVTYCILI